MPQLTVNRPQHIKVVYRNLKKFRTEQEENYLAPMVQLSNSDYHHVGRPAMKRSATRTSLLGSNQRRTMSNYSIATDNARRPSIQSRRDPSEAGTDQSYDPFRVSRHQIAQAEADHAKITILPRSSVASKNTRNLSTATSIRHPAVARIQDDESFSFSSSPPQFPLDARGNVRELRRKAVYRAYSRSSIASSQFSVTSSKIFTKSASHKRRIRFDHSSRSSSNQRSSPPPRPAAPTPLNFQQRFIRDQTSTPIGSSPLANAVEDDRAIRSRKEGVSLKPSKRTTKLWEEKTRQVSKELSFFCDQAFNKGGSASFTSEQEFEDDPNLTALPQTPDVAPVPPSKPNGGRANSFLYRSRPLPKPPVNELMVTHTHMELAKAREKLTQRARYLEHGELDEIIGHIERLMEANSRLLSQQEQEKRVASAPEASPGLLSGLSPVKEEPENSKRRNGKSSRHASEPASSKDVYHMDPSRMAWEKDPQTIRLVDDIEADDIPAPLRVRKKNSAFALRSFHRLKPQKSEDSFLGSNFRASASKPDVDGTMRPFPWTDIQGHGTSTGLNSQHFQLEAIGEDGDKEIEEPRGPKRGSGENKVKNWFRRSGSSQHSSGSEKGPTPPAKDEWVTHGNASRVGPSLQPVAHSDTTSDDIPMREVRREKPSGTSKFLSMFSKKNSKKPSDMSVLGKALCPK